MFFDDPTAAFANVRRALRPGGRLAFVCWQGLDRNDWMRIPAAAAASVLGAPLSVPHAAGPGPFSLADPDRIRSVLGPAGFRDIDVSPQNDRLSFPVAQVPAFAVDSTAHGAVREALRSADEATCSRVQAAIEAALVAEVDDGRVNLARGVHVVTADT